MTEGRCGCCGACARRTCGAVRCVVLCPFKCAYKILETHVHGAIAKLVCSWIQPVAIFGTVGATLWYQNYVTVSMPKSDDMLAYGTAYGTAYLRGAWDNFNATDYIPSPLSSMSP